MQLAFPNDPFIPECEPKAERPPSDPDVRCKLPEALKKELSQALREDGYNEMQTGLIFIINMYLVRRRHEEDIKQAG